MPTPYIKQTWENVPSVATPLSAARMTHIEDGIGNSVSVKGWEEGWMDSVTSPPGLHDIPDLFWAAAATTGKIVTPVEYKPEKCGLGVQTLDWDGLSDPVFRYWPGRFRTEQGGALDLVLTGELKPGGSAQAANWQVVASFTTSANVSVVEIAYFGASNEHKLFIEVDGQPITDRVIPKPAALGVGTSMSVALTFPTSRVRTIRVAGQSLRAVRVETGNTISKPPAPTRRIAIVGDSFVNGAGTSGTYPNQGAQLTETFAPTLCKMLGGDDIMLAGIGGAGWVTGGATNAYYTRLSVVLAASPEVIVFFGSVNDVGVADATIQAAVESALATCSAVPEIYVIGPPVTGADAVNAAVKAGTLAAGRKYIDMRGFIYGTGKVTNRTGDGNADHFKIDDNIHPTFAAHKAIARAAYRQIIAGI